MSSQLDWHWLLARPSLQICKTTTLHTHTLTHVPLVLTFNWKFCAVFAEASCAAAVRAAQDIVADIGVEAASRSGGLLELSRKRPKNGERDCQHLMAKKLRLSLPIAQHYLDTKDDSLKLPFLRFRDWLSFLLKHNCLHILCGLVKPNPDRQGDIFEAFWRRFAIHHPDHPVIQRAERGEISLRRTVPLLLHGDEGRSKKRSPFLVCNLHSPLGRGVEAGLREGRRREYLKMLPNFTGHSYTNRFLVSCLPKQDYCGKNSFVFDILMQTIAEELHHCASEGVQHEGQRYLAVCIGIVGDWPWLCKAGGLQRSFMNVNKHKEDAGGRRRSECRGVCHLCRAGQPDWPYEQIGSRTPLWEATMLTQSPFQGPCCLEIIPHCPGKFPDMFKFDVFHTWHLGVGKNFLGGMLALLSELEDGSNVDVRFEQLSARYKAWCRQNGKTAYCQRITKEHLNWISKSHYPTGSWHKGDLTTTLMLWVESRFHAEQWQDEMLALAGQAAVAINKAVRLMYTSGAWMEQATAGECADLGLRFLRRYNSLALLAHAQNKRLWLVMPKAHALHHLFLHLLQQSNVGRCFNLICTSVQQDEDFIGRNSRLSRHVSTLTCAQRVMERHLQACYAQYVEAGYLVSVGSSWYIFCSTWPSPHLKNMVNLKPFLWFDSPWDWPTDSLQLMDKRLGLDLRQVEPALAAPPGKKIDEISKPWVLDRNPGFTGPPCEFFRFWGLRYVLYNESWQKSYANSL